MKTKIKTIKASIEEVRTEIVKLNETEGNDGTIKALLDTINRALTTIEGLNN